MIKSSIRRTVTPAPLTTSRAAIPIVSVRPTSTRRLNRTRSTTTSAPARTTRISGTAQSGPRLNRDGKANCTAIASASVTSTGHGLSGRALAHHARTLSSTGAPAGLSSALSVWVTRSRAAFIVSATWSGRLRAGSFTSIQARPSSVCATAGTSLAWARRSYWRVHASVTAPMRGNSTLTHSSVLRTMISARRSTAVTPTDASRPLGMPLTTEWQAPNVRVPDSGRSLAAGGRDCCRWRSWS
jgi:hypothetical protein